MSIVKTLSKIQAELKAPKGQRNTFGKYNYRSAEDILEAVKPLTAKNGLILTLSDEIELIGDRIYVKATARLTNGEQEVVTVAFAREEASKKGMDASQVTGAASSYARKYALNGLFCIDDNKDSDATNTHGKAESKPAAKKPAAKKPAANKAAPSNLFEKSLKHIDASKDQAAAAKAVLNKYADEFTADQRKQLEQIASLAKTLS
tara:strand:+ start:181 stop:795 length:615 start_codon:yes stop_codon:yes gene_type:complete